MHRFFFLTVLALPTLATAGEAAGPYAGVHVGGTVPLSPLKATWAPMVEAGVRLPALNDGLAIWGTAWWRQPLTFGEVTDDRFGSGSFQYEVQQDELNFGLGLAWVGTALELPVTPEVGVGPTVYLLRSTAYGAQNGNGFGENTEEYTRVGVQGYIAGNLALGPGELTLRLQMAASGFGGVVTGKASTAAFEPMLGYRLTF